MGCAYTWDNRQFGDSNVKARLDIAFANEEFRQHYEYICVKHLFACESDHCFVVADLQTSLPGRSHPARQGISDMKMYGNRMWIMIDLSRMLGEAINVHRDCRVLRTLLIILDAPLPLGC